MSFFISVLPLHGSLNAVMIALCLIKYSFYIISFMPEHYIITTNKRNVMLDTSVILCA